MRTQHKFEMNGKVFPNLDLAGVSISNTEYGNLVHQSGTAATLKELSKNATYHDFHTVRHKWVRLCITRPDICAAAHISLQVASNTFPMYQLKGTNKRIMQVLETNTRALRYHKLDLDLLCIVAITDASSANSLDTSSQLGHQIESECNTGGPNVFSYGGYNSKRLVRSVLSGETYTFAVCFDAAFTYMMK